MQAINFFKLPEPFKTAVIKRMNFEDYIAFSMLSAKVGRLLKANPRWFRWCSISISDSGSCKIECSDRYLEDRGYIIQASFEPEQMRIRVFAPIIAPGLVMTPMVIIPSLAIDEQSKLAFNGKILSSLLNAVNFEQFSMICPARSEILEIFAFPHLEKLTSFLTTRGHLTAKEFHTLLSASRIVHLHLDNTFHFKTSFKGVLNFNTLHLTNASWLNQANMVAMNVRELVTTERNPTVGVRKLRAVFTNWMKGHSDFLQTIECKVKYQTNQTDFLNGIVRGYPEAAVPDHPPQEVEEMEIGSRTFRRTSDDKYMYVGIKRGEQVVKLFASF